MSEALKVFLSLLAGTVSFIIPHPNHSIVKNQTAVKGVSIRKTPTNSVTPTIPVTTIPLRLPTVILTPMIKQSTQKQYGAWYWQSQLNKSQMWIGIDSAGKDIFVDHLPTPTPLPTKSPDIKEETSKPREVLPNDDHGGVVLEIQVKKVGN